MKKISSFSEPSALQAKPSVILFLLPFLPDICFVARPLSGGALYGWSVN